MAAHSVEPVYDGGGAKPIWEMSAEAIEPCLLAVAMPALASEIATLLVEAGESELAAQVPRLRIVDRCRCGDHCCATMYTEPKPAGRYGPGHRNLMLSPQQGMLILDIVADRIMCVEVLDRDEVRKALLALMP
jgi:hypothetical protein